MKLALWLTIILLAAGCSDKYVAENLTAENGCKIKCDWCVKLDATCVSDYKLEKNKKTDKFNPLSTPDIEVDVEISK